ncbi:universal stress protein [Streptomyces sp. TS71-3]|uniref:universal stress protein n=1 Tax=Streptomyces sp. TS71-3 TaxID=2733862 RepID=UPI001BB3D293|nr:universal stress protein [Streptomyces sp. TS71-3]
MLPLRPDEALRTMPTHGAHVRLECSETTDIAGDLVRCAQTHGCDLIVIGRRGEDHQVRTTGLGPVAETVCQSTQLPVLPVTHAPHLT